jgi:uncharacterized protein YgiM (DUF1202 family)
VRANWIGIVAIILAVLVLLANRAAWAAPPNQTVPPRPTDTPTPAPQATNTPDNDDDDDDQQQQPTSTPTSTPGQPAQPAQPAGEALTGVVTAERLNVREGPGTDFAVVGRVLQGETVRILERNEAGSWWRICCASGTETEGWVSAQFIQPNFDATQANTLIPVAGAAPAPAPTTAPTVAASDTTTTTTTASTTTIPTTTVESTTTTTPTVEATTTTTATAEIAEAVTPTLSLDLIITQVPTFAWQGQELELQFVITNPGDTTASDVELRDELMPELTFVSADIFDNGELEEQTGDEGRFVFSIRWLELGPGESLTARVTLQVAEDVPDGAVIDNLAVVSAENAAPYTAGISIGLPPTTPPDFQ